MNRLKTGILSMQRVVNYGSFLQAWALREMLRECGARDIRFIDIDNGRQLPGYEYNGIKAFMKNLLKLLSVLLKGENGKRLRNKAYYARLKEQFTSDFFPMLDLDPADNNIRYDLVVIGSDEVFNCCQASPWGFTTQLYGDVPNAGSVYSYAGTFGNTTYGEIIKLGISGQIATALKNIRSVSVRDDNSLEIIRQLTGQMPLVHFDPVLMYRFQKETSGLPTDISDYILIYSYTDRINDPDEIAAIRDLAAKENKKLVTLMCRYDWCDQAMIPETPFHAIELFRNADFVITDTYHGTALSVITQNSFCTLIRDSNRNKLGYLLSSLGIMDRQACTAADISRLYGSKPDYDQVNNILEIERARTMEYLTNMFSDGSHSK